MFFRGAAGALALAAAVATAAPAPPDLSGDGRLVVYTPRGWSPAPGWRARAGGLRADARALHAAGFRALVTERATAALAPVCRFFKRYGFATVVIGIADPGDAAELRAAMRLRRCADGYAVGNGGLAAGRYGRAALTAAVDLLRRRTGRPATPREAPESYEADPTLLLAGDWIFPVPPAMPAVVDAQVACGLTAAVYRALLERGPQDRPLTLAAVGLSTTGGRTEHHQRAYVLCLETRSVRFAIFEAFDQPWRAAPDGPGFGVFRADGTPKLWARQRGAP